MKFSDFKKSVLENFQELKSKKFGEVIIPGLFDKKEYKLVLLTSECSDNYELMKLLSDWRKKHEFWFQAQFPISVERTTNWFDKKVIREPDRVLFVIEIDGLYVGHTGLFRFDFSDFTCEIDNVVRGEDSVFPGIIGDAVVSLMNWGKVELGIKNYRLQTTSDNEKALRLYGRLGFIETKRIPLIYKKTEEGGEWIEAPLGYDKSIERYDVYMELKSNS